MKSNNSVIKVEPGHLNVSPFGFFHFGKEFFDAAKAFKPPEHFSPVPYFLYCRSIELVLKAFILGKGVPKRDLPKKSLYGHDLGKLLKTAQALGLHEFVEFTQKQEAEILRANKYYNSKGFEYFDVFWAGTGYSGLPELITLEAVATELVNRLKAFCINVA